MIWLVAVALGFLLPWVIRWTALCHVFSQSGIWSGITLWGYISVVTVPFATLLAFFFRVMF